VSTQRNVAGALPSAVSAGAPLPSLMTSTQRARRERIIDSALELLACTPYEKIQMREVAEDAGVALGTLYRYFNSKEHLFASVVVKWAARFDDRVHSRPLRGATNEERLVDVYSRAVRALQRMPQFLPAIRVVGASEDPYAIESLAALDHLTETTYRRALDGIDEADGRLIIYSATMVMNGLLGRWMQGCATIEQVYDDMRRAIHVIVGFSIDF